VVNIGEVRVLSIERTPNLGRGWRSPFVAAVIVLGHVPPADVTAAFPCRGPSSRGNTLPRRTACWCTASQSACSAWVADVANIQGERICQRTLHSQRPAEDIGVLKIRVGRLNCAEAGWLPHFRTLVSVELG